MAPRVDDEPAVLEALRRSRPRGLDHLSAEFVASIPWLAIRGDYDGRMPTLVNPLCPNCGAALPPREASAVYACTFCQHKFEVDGAGPPGAHGPPLAERTTSADFPALVAEAERLIAEVQRGHAPRAAEAANMGGTAALLGKAASKKLEQRYATTRQAVAERDEATLRDCVDRLASMVAIDAG